MNNISGVLLRLNVRVSTTYEVPPCKEHGNVRYIQPEESEGWSEESCKEY